MNHTAHITLAITLADGKAPTSFRLFTAGTVTTSKGNFVFDEKAATAVLAAWAEQGNDLPIDYDHAMVDPTTRPQDRGAAGWFRPEVRDGELWAANVRWTADGERAVASGEWRFTSPAFSYDVDSRRITELVNVAITNLPATKRMAPLVAIHALDRRVALSAAASFDDVTRAVVGALAEAFDDPWLVAIYDDRAIFSCQGRTWSVAYTFDGTDAALVGEPVEVRADWQPLTKPTLAASRGTHGAKPKGHTMKNILAALSLAENATESDAIVALTKIQTDAKELFALTGKPNHVEALGVVRGWQACSTEHAALSARVAEMEAEASAAKLEELIKLGKSDGKLVPAQEAWARSQSPAALEAFLSSAPRVVPQSPGKQGSPPEVVGKAWSELSTAEKHRLANDNPEAFAALKAAATR